MTLFSTAIHNKIHQFTLGDLRFPVEFSAHATVVIKQKKNQENNAPELVRVSKRNHKSTEE